MIQWVGASATKANDISSEIHVMERENQLMKVVVRPLCMHRSIHLLNPSKINKYTGCLTQNV